MWSIIELVEGDVLCTVPTWGIIAIVIVVLIVLLCVGFLVRKLLSKKRHKGKDAKKGMKGAMDVKGAPMLGALTSKVRKVDKLRMCWITECTS